MIAGHFNAKVGANTDSKVSGKYGLGTPNKRGEDYWTSGMNIDYQKRLTLSDTQHYGVHRSGWVSMGQ